MFGSEILEVAIGLILIFLLFSLILTAAREAIEAWLKSRARNLDASLRELLGPENLTAFYSHPLIFALYKGMAPEHGRIGGRGPSYIPARNFAIAVADIMGSTGKLPADSPALRVYESAKAAAQDNLDRARGELEVLYDSAMDRASGWYRRRTQNILLWLGLALAVALNVNAFGIARHLAADDELRRQVVALAEAEAGPNAPGTVRANAITTALYEKGLPIGWNDARWTAVAGDGRAALEGGNRAAILRLIELVLGYLAVALAGMLGAPFWFDVLNKFMVIRSTVKPHEKSPEEASEDRQVRRKVS